MFPVDGGQCIKRKLSCGSISIFRIPAFLLIVLPCSTAGGEDVNSKKCTSIFSSSRTTENEARKDMSYT